MVISYHSCQSTQKRSKWGEEKDRMFSLRRKRASGNVMLEPSPVLEEIKSLIKMELREWFSQRKAPPTKLPTCEKK